MPAVFAQSYRHTVKRVLACLCVVALAAGTLWSAWPGDDTPEAWRTVVTDADDDGQGESIGRLIRAAHVRRDADRANPRIDRQTGHARSAGDGPLAIVVGMAALDGPPASRPVAAAGSGAPVTRPASSASRAPPLA